MHGIITDNILETIEMIKLHHLDIRTVTLSLSLRDCICNNAKDTGPDNFSKTFPFMVKGIYIILNINIFHY